MYTLTLTLAERQYLIETVASFSVWPPNDELSWLMIDLPLEIGEVAGGPEFRVRLLRWSMIDTEEYLVEVSLTELWLLDSVVLTEDLRQAKLPDGTPLRNLAVKIWAVILEAYKGGELDDTNKVPDQDHDWDAQQTIREAEALLRPRHREGTS